MGQMKFIPFFPRFSLYVSGLSRPDKRSFTVPEPKSLKNCYQILYRWGLQSDTIFNPAGSGLDFHHSSGIRPDHH